LTDPSRGSVQHLRRGAGEPETLSKSRENFFRPGNVYYLDG